jgi:hypothetical protein
MVYFHTQKIPIWVYCGGPYNIRCWYILWQFGLFYRNLVYLTEIWSILQKFGIFCGHLVYFVAIWYILWSFGRFFVLVCCTKKNLATLPSVPDELRQDGLLLHERELLADAVSRAGRERDVGVRVAGSTSEKEKC